MPELPDVTLYVETLDAHLTGHVLEGVRVAGPSLLQTWEPPVEAAAGRAVRGFRRIGKRIVFELEGELFLVVHPMIAGRFKWRDRGAKLARKLGLAAFDFDHGALLLTEAGTRKRATLHVIQGEAGLAGFDRGGVDVLAASPAAFAAPLRAENHTLKRSLTDPRLYDGIGNAYSDEILHRARLSPLKLSRRLTGEETERLRRAAVEVLREWTDRLRIQAGGKIPEKVTAFHPEMAVHGKFRKPCPVCGDPVQRIAYADNETNYCATCQTGGRLLADRAMSRLLRKDWPRSLEALEEHRKH